MWTYKYGEFNDNQAAYTKQLMRKQIFLLLLIVDPKTRDEYENMKVDEVFSNVLKKFGGLNTILNYPNELVDIIISLQAAQNEYNSPTFSIEDFKHSAYRKLILDAGAKVLEIKED